MTKQAAVPSFPGGGETEINADNSVGTNLSVEVRILLLQQKGWYFRATLFLIGFIILIATNPPAALEVGLWAPLEFLAVAVYSTLFFSFPDRAPLAGYSA